MLDKRPPAIFIMGPTASGKTAIAIELARRFPIDLISVDSALVYRGMDVGTAKPDKQTLLQFPHALVDIRDPAQAYSAAEFASDAAAQMHKASAANKIPLLVGGTSLYFRALEYGLSDMPEADPQVRAEIAAQAESEGWAALHKRLAELDPKVAARIHRNDPQRIARALEVISISGNSMSSLQSGKVTRPPFRILKIIACPNDRAILHARIEQRLHIMFAQGIVEEVRALLQNPNLHDELPSMRAVGYRQVLGYLRGEYDLPTAQNKALFATRQLAKRQLTWLRSEWDAVWRDPLSLNFVEDISGMLKRFLPAAG